MGDWVKVHVPCICGKSSDAFCTNVEGDGHCFSCGKHFFNDKEEDLDDNKYTLEVFEHRGLNKRTLEKFGVKTKFLEGVPIETAFSYSNGSIKVRNMLKKDFRTVGDMKNATLFGKNIFDRGSKSAITLTEGEYDALSVSQIVGDGIAVCSVRSASSAMKDCTVEHDYINSFDKIIINFDNDEPGQDAAKKVASLFDFKKVFNLCLEKGKDANDYLEKGMGKDYYEAWNGVKRYTPDNILSTWSQFASALQSKKEQRIGTYPFESLQNMLHGLHAGEVIVFKGAEGLGKSESLRAIENHLLKTTKHAIGFIHLEEDNGTTLKGIAAYHTKDGLLHPESNYSDQDVLKAIQESVGGDEGRIFLHSSFDVEDEKSFTDNVRFLVAGCGCRFIFLDHISWLATGDKGDDERLKLDRISQKLKLLAKELEFCLIEISHVNDDGKTRGSRNITKVANTVIHLSRDLTSSDPVERNKLYMLVEKARLAGAQTGPAGYAVYDRDTLLLQDPLEGGLQIEKQN